MSKKYRDWVVARIRAGEDIKALAVELNSTEEFLRKLESDYPHKEKQLQGRPRDQEIRDAICRLSDQGKFAPEIAEELGRPLGSVYSILAASRPDRPRKPYSRQTESLQRKTTILNLLDEGNTQTQVAKQTGVSHQYVSLVAKERRMRG